MRASEWERVREREREWIRQSRGRGRKKERKVIDGTQPKNSSGTGPGAATVRKFDPDDLSSSAATRPQEVSLNLANVKFSSEHFQIQSLKPAFRGENDDDDDDDVWKERKKTVRKKRKEKKRKERREEKRKITEKKRNTQIIRLRQSAITSYFPRHRSNQFRPSPKNNRPGGSDGPPSPPPSVSQRYSPREQRRAKLCTQVLQDSIQSLATILSNLLRRIDRGWKRKRTGGRDGENTRPDFRLCVFRSPCQNLAFFVLHPTVPRPSMFPRGHYFSTLPVTFFS